MSRDCEAAVSNRLAGVNGVVVGFIDRNQVFPVRVESPTTTGDWPRTVEVLREHRLNVVLRDDPLPPDARNVYFVKCGVKNIYRLDTFLMRALLQDNESTTTTKQTRYR